MKACVLHGIRDLRYEEIKAPEMSEPDELIVKIMRGGICGSDVHYYLEGGAGATIRVREPIVIGHEGCGIVERIGAGVTGIKEGDMVAIRPARPCRHCYYCENQMPTFCENMRHLGSAALFPHTAGLFSEKVVLRQDQARVVQKMAPEIAAFAEPLAVAYRGVHMLGDVIGRDVLVMGAGPIGALCAVSAKVLGANSVTVVDVRQAPLDIVRKMGIQNICNSKENPGQIEEWKQHKGQFDLFIEASGNAAALYEGMAMLRPQGTISQVGTFSAGHEPHLGLLMPKGLKWHGSFRFYEEFGPAVNALENGLINPLPLLTNSFPAAQCVAAMEEACAPQSAKVQVYFD